jgi:RNA polymerase sigma-70 factor, ECF subfamily
LVHYTDKQCLNPMLNSMTETNSSDRSLVIRLRNGEDDAATEFYERYVKRLFGLVHQQMADHLRAAVQPEDIVQSVFKSVFRGLTTGDYDAPQSGSLWHLIAIVAVHKVRRNARKRTATKRDDRRNQPLDALEDSGLVGSASPEEFEAALREAIEGLKPLEQEVAMLRVQGLTVEEISSKLQRSRRGIERTLHIIREKLIQGLDVSELPDG